MITFQAPHLLLLLLFAPLIWPLNGLFTPWSSRNKAQAGKQVNRGIPFASPLPAADLNELFSSIRARIRGPLLTSLLLAAYILAVIAIARPQRETVFESQQWSGRDLLLALDISGSMRALDFIKDGARVERLEALKYVMGEFVESRKGDRIGLVVFGDQVFTQCPLTLDHTAVLKFLNELEVGMAGQGTAIGDALAISLKRLQQIEAKSKAIILVTDGKNNSGNVAPIEMARLARDRGIKIYVVGIGGTEPAPLPVRSALGFTTIIQRPMEYDEETLRLIAETTNGIYFNAKNLAGLQDVYRQIDRLELRETATTAQVDREELFLPFAAAAFVSLTMFLILRSTVFLKVGE